MPVTASRRTRRPPANLYGRSMIGLPAQRMPRVTRRMLCRPVLDLVGPGMAFRPILSRPRHLGRRHYGPGRGRHCPLGRCSRIGRRLRRRGRIRRRHGLGRRNCDRQHGQAVPKAERIGQGGCGDRRCRAGPARRIRCQYCCIGEIAGGAADRENGQRQPRYAASIPGRRCVGLIPSRLRACPGGFVRRLDRRPRPSRPMDCLARRLAPGGRALGRGTWHRSWLLGDRSRRRLERRRRLGRRRWPRAPPRRLGRAIHIDIGLVKPVGHAAPSPLSLAILHCNNRVCRWFGP